jgi:hypothetical protein
MARQRMRSPNYPAIGLPEALRRVEAIYKGEHQNSAPRDVLVRHMGFSGVNGASLGVLSALIKYGLLEPTSDKELRVSPLALEILYPESDEEKSAAITTAAQHPPLFQEFRERWPDRPPSNALLKAYLVRRGFGQTALDSVIRSFRETYDLVTELSGDYPVSLSPKREGDESHADAESAAPTKPAPSRSTQEGPAPGFRVSVTDDFLLDVSGSQLDASALERLINVLNANKPVLRTATDPVAVPSASDEPESDGPDCSEGSDTDEEEDAV